MSRILIIGFGNPLRGDDGLGPAALRELEPVITGDVEFIECHQLVPELADDLSKADLAILIDAAEEGEPGAVVVTEVYPVVPPGQSFTHHVNPSSLLAMAAELFGHAPRAFLITVAGVDFGCKTELSTAIQQALREIVQRVQEIVAGHIPATRN